MRRETIESIVAEIVDVMAAHREFEMRAPIEFYGSGEQTA